jgi:hypothetical protein
MPEKPEKAQNERESAAKPISMHDNVEVWEDCCVCEPEPRWRELAEELEREQATRDSHCGGSSLPDEKRGSPM